MGKSSAAPPAPDYIGAAKQQGIDNLTAARQSNVMSNPNMYTPFGNQTVTYSAPTFDQASFDAALAKYNAGNVDRNRYYRPDEQTGQTYFDQASFDADNAKRGAAPTREGFMTGGGQPQFNGNALVKVCVPLPDLETQRTIVAEIEAEQALVNANRELIRRMEAKVKVAIDRVWGNEG